MKNKAEMDFQSISKTAEVEVGNVFFCKAKILFFMKDFEVFNSVSKPSQEWFIVVC